MWHPKEDCATWDTEATDDLYESVSLGRSILTLDYDQHKVSVWWLSIVKGRRAHYHPPSYLVDACRAWLNSYRGIPFDDFMRKLFHDGPRVSD